MASSLAAPGSQSASCEPSTALGAPSHAWLWRWLFPALGVVSLISSCILWSSRKQLAGDELFTRVEIADPSLGHLLRAALHLGGAGMPLFYGTAWIWTDAFGLGDLSLRLYSCAGVCAAFLVLVAAMGRRFGPRPAFLGVAFALFSCLLVIGQNVEARGYGLYLLLAALAVVQALRVAEKPRPGALDLVLLALSQAGLVLGHVLGLIYAGLILVALFAGDRWQRRIRMRVYLSCIAGWLALVPWIPAIQASAAVGQPHSWIPMPTIADLAIGLSFWLFGGLYFPPLQNHPLGLIAGWGCAIVCAAVLMYTTLAALTREDEPRRPVWLMALALLAAPVIFFLVSRLVSPVYVARYMIPSVIGVAIAAVARAAGWKNQQGPRGILLGVAFLLVPVVTALVARPSHLDVAQIDRLADGRGVICPWLQDFLIMNRYSTAARRPVYPMDESAALRGPAAAIGGFHLMQNYRQVGYLAFQIRDAGPLLKQPSFLVLDDTETNWFQVEIASRPQYSSNVIATLDAKHRLIAVTRR